MYSFVEIYNNEAMCGTWAIHFGFDREHKEVLKLCRKYVDSFMRLDNNKGVPNTFIIRKQIRQTAGQPVTEYMLNEQQCIFLGTLFRAKANPEDRVLQFKEQLAIDFVKQKRIISSLIAHKSSKEYIRNRAAGKIVRKDETDAIKAFKLYCEEQGSTHADKYYIIFSKVVNSTMFNFQGTFKNKRESMTANQLLDIKFADRIVERGIMEGMAQCLPYKEIYQLVKGRLISLAGMYGKSEVINKQLDLFEQ